jgi:hypothetical protein
MPITDALTAACPACGRPLDARRACWGCCDRLCPCGRPTGSAFIELCRVCEVDYLRGLEDESAGAVQHQAGATAAGRFV